MFSSPKMIKKQADTEVPMIPPTRLKAPNLELMAEAVAATTMDVTTTMLNRLEVNLEPREPVMSFQVRGTSEWKENNYLR